MSTADDDVNVVRIGTTTDDQSIGVRQPGDDRVVNSQDLGFGDINVGADLGGQNGKRAPSDDVPRVVPSDKVPDKVFFDSKAVVDKSIQG